jgi:hypothetical protein
MIFMFTRSYTIQYNTIQYNTIQCKQRDPDAGFITNKIFLIAIKTYLLRMYGTL